MLNTDNCYSVTEEHVTGFGIIIYLAIGFLDHPERFAPQAHAYWRMRLPWLDFADALPRIDGYSRGRDPDVGDPANRQSGADRAWP